MARDLVAFLPPRWRAGAIGPEEGKAVSAELVGTLVFVFLANLSSTALGVGVSYAVASYGVSALSGGHLNPVISLAQAFSGHMHFALAGLYVLAQALGSIAAALLEAVLIPGVHLGHHSQFTPPGCLVHHTTNWFHLVLWEFILTFIFIMVVYGVFVGHEKFSAVAPLAAGLTIYAAIEAGGEYSGAIVNPARLIGPAIVFLCGWKHFWLYILAHLLAAVAGAFFAVGNFGAGPVYGNNRDDLDERVPGLGERLMPEDA